MEAEFNWHTKEFQEMARGMQKDDIFYVGAREPILVKYVTKCLLNKLDQDADRVNVREGFRMVAKVLHAVSVHVGKPVKMTELCNIKPYYNILTGLGSGAIPTDVFDFKKVAL